MKLAEDQVLVDSGGPRSAPFRPRGAGRGPGGMDHTPEVERHKIGEETVDLAPGLSKAEPLAVRFVQRTHLGVGTVRPLAVELDRVSGLSCSLARFSRMISGVARRLRSSPGGSTVPMTPATGSSPLVSPHRRPGPDVMVHELAEIGIGGGKLHLHDRHAAERNPRGQLRRAAGRRSAPGVVPVTQPTSGSSDAGKDNGSATGPGHWRGGDPVKQVVRAGDRHPSSFRRISRVRAERAPVHQGAKPGKSRRRDPSHIAQARAPARGRRAGDRPAGSAPRQARRTRTAGTGHPAPCGSLRPGRSCRAELRLRAGRAVAGPGQNLRVTGAHRKLHADFGLHHFSHGGQRRIGHQGARCGAGLATSAPGIGRDRRPPPAARCRSIEEPGPPRPLVQPPVQPGLLRRSPPAAGRRRVSCPCHHSAASRSTFHSAAARALSRSMPPRSRSNWPRPAGSTQDAGTVQMNILRQHRHRLPADPARSPGRSLAVAALQPRQAIKMPLRQACPQFQRLGPRRQHRLLRRQPSTGGRPCGFNPVTPSSRGSATWEQRRLRGMKRHQLEILFQRLS